MAYILSNKCAKNCCELTIPVQLIVELIVDTCFLGYSIVMRCIKYATYSVLMWTGSDNKHIYAANKNWCSRYEMGQHTFAATYKALHTIP